MTHKSKVWLEDSVEAGMTIKVMYLADYFDVPQGGTEGQILQLIQHLDRSRYEPAIALFRSSDYIEHNPFPCPVRVLGIKKLVGIRTVLEILRFAYSLRRENYRLVHCYFNDSALIAPVFLWLFRIRVLVSRRDMGFWHTPWNLLVLRLVTPFVNRYVANSEAVKRVVEHREWAPSEKIHVIYNGYAPAIQGGGEAEYSPMPPELSDGVPVVGIVANLKPIKRIDTLIEAFALASRQHPVGRLVVVGDNSSTEGERTFSELEALASRLGIRDRVFFTGRVAQPMLYIRRFAVAVLCSESEGFSNSIIEYMQAARPIICTDTGGNTELVEDGRNGLVVPVGDIRGMALCLTRILSDDALAHRLGEAAYETVRAYTHVRMVREQMACYDEVLSGSGSRPGLRR